LKKIKVIRYIYYQYNYDIQNYFQKDDLNNLKNVLNNNKNSKDKLMYLVSDNGNVYRIKKGRFNKK
jgi:hypothetical protein